MSEVFHYETFANTLFSMIIDKDRQLAEFTEEFRVLNKESEDMAAIIKYQDRIHKEIQEEKLTISLERQRLKEELEHFRAVQSPPSSLKTPQ